MIDSKLASRAYLIRIFCAYLRVTYVCKRLYALVIFYILAEEFLKHMIISTSPKKMV